MIKVTERQTPAKNNFGGSMFLRLIIAELHSGMKYVLFGLKINRVHLMLCTDIIIYFTVTIFRNSFLQYSHAYLGTKDKSSNTAENLVPDIQVQE